MRNDGSSHVFLLNQNKLKYLTKWEDKEWVGGNCTLTETSFSGNSSSYSNLTPSPRYKHHPILCREIRVKLARGGYGVWWMLSVSRQIGDLTSNASYLDIFPIRRTLLGMKPYTFYRCGNYTYLIRTNSAVVFFEIISTYTYFHAHVHVTTPLPYLQ